MQISLHKNVRTTPAMRRRVAATLIAAVSVRSAQALASIFTRTGCKAF